MNGIKDQAHNSTWKMIKSSTLSRLKPEYLSSEYQKKILMNNEVDARISSNFERDEIEQDLIKTASFNNNLQKFKENKALETLNSSWTSQNNVDCSDIVLKGDVNPSTKRKESNLNMGSQVPKFNLISEMVGMPTNTRYGCEGNVVDSSKISPKLTQKMKNMGSFEISNQERQQSNLIAQLQEEVKYLKEKLKFYEENCTWSKNKKEIKHSITQTKNLDTVEQKTPAVRDIKMILEEGDECNNSRDLSRIKSPKKKIKSEDLKIDKIITTPLRKVIDKSPMLSKEEADDLFKSRNTRYWDNENNDDSDASYMQYRMVNPMDKSGFTPNSISKSNNKSNLKRCTDDWTMEIPKIKNYDQSECSSSNKDSP